MILPPPGTTQLNTVYSLMCAGDWFTLKGIERSTGIPMTSALRKLSQLDNDFEIPHERRPCKGDESVNEYRLLINGQVSIQWPKTITSTATTFLSG